MKKQHSLPVGRQGFTLIELLVVIAVIGILASVVLASLNSARAKARNAKRVANLHEIQTALEFYYSDYGYYPPTNMNAWRSECPYWTTSPPGTATVGYAAKDVIPGLVPTYMSSFPSDPSMNIATDSGCYLYRSNGIDYVMLDHTISDTNFSYQSFPSLIDPARDSGPDCSKVDGTGIWSWKIYSPGAVCW